MRTAGAPPLVSFVASSCWMDSWDTRSEILPEKSASRQVRYSVRSKLAGPHERVQVTTTDCRLRVYVIEGTVGFPYRDLNEAGPAADAARACCQPGLP